MAIDKNTLLDACKGREREILQHVAGFDAEVLDGGKWPCPNCGGTKRFNYKAANGRTYCSHECEIHCGDVIDAVMALKDLSFPAALKAVAAFIGFEGDEDDGPASRFNGSAVASTNGHANGVAVAAKPKAAAKPRKAYQDADEATKAAGSIQLRGKGDWQLVGTWDYRNTEREHYCRVLRFNEYNDAGQVHWQDVPAGVANRSGPMGDVRAAIPTTLPTRRTGGRPDDIYL